MQDLVFYKAYEFDNISQNKCAFIIDTSANIGLYSCFAAEKASTVYACELEKNPLG